MSRCIQWGAAAALALGSTGHAQTIGVSCPRFMQNVHQRLSCVEALLSQDNYHFTLASLPPGNGFAPGLVLTHTFTHIAGNQLDLSVTGAVSTNGSTYEAGDALWTLPYGSRDISTQPEDLQSATQKDWNAMSFHLQGGHQAVNTIDFYGDGQRSSPQRFVYAEDDVWGRAIARIPISRRVLLVGETGLRATTLPISQDAEAVNRNLPVSTLPAYTEQPLFAVSRVGIETRVDQHFGHPLPDDSVAHHLLQYFFNWQWQNNAAYSWFHDAESSTSSFRQFRFEGNEMGLLFGRVVPRSYRADEHPIMYHTVCQGESRKRAESCNLLLVNVRSRLILSDVSPGSEVPFYLQPTLGGSDFDNYVTLRGWDNYRFRDRDSALTQVDMNFIVRDPFGLDLFYDAGSVGKNIGDLTMTHWRQDGGVGLTLRLQGSIVAQSYWAWGAGHGAHWSYNFAKMF